MTGCHLREELLCFSQKCLHAAHEKRHKVGAGSRVIVCGRQATCCLSLEIICDFSDPRCVFSLRVVVLDKVTDVLLFFGKLLVVGGVGKKDCIKKVF